LLLLSAVASALGLLGGGAAYVLIKLIALLTNLALFHRVGWELPNFADLDRGPLLIVVAAASGVVVMLLARWSPEIRGHGIPEAMDAVLTKQSRIRPRTAIAKPLSAAIAIGAGGPFGAEGPIIVTGGALGSLLGQVLPVSPSERKILLACGAAAGMAATFGTPLAAVVLVIELLLFEFSARAFVPLVVSTALAGGVHSAIFGTGPLFEVPPHDYHGLDKLPWFALLGVLAGLLAVVVSNGLFLVEHLYARLPGSDRWHPILGAVAFAFVGLAQPRALGVGYDVISDVLLGKIAAGALAALAIAKLVAWWVALASGTSGGTLAPLLLISGAFGSLFGTAMQHIDPGIDISPGAFALVAMAATFGASIGATFAAIVYLFELTRDYDIILPLMLASVIAKAIADALMHDNLMTEKLSRRGVRVESDYAVDVLASVTVADVMTTAIDTLPIDATVGQARQRIERGGHGAFPIVDSNGACVAVIARQDLLELESSADRERAIDHASTDVISVPSSTPLVVALQRLLDEGIGHLPIVDGGRLMGICTRTDILRARQRTFANESRQPGWRPHRRHVLDHFDPELVDLPKETSIVHHYLVVGNQTLSGPALQTTLDARLELGPSRVYVLVPTTRSRDLFSSVIGALEGDVTSAEQARIDATDHLEAALAWLRERGAEADGEVGDSDPLAAVASVLKRQHFDEVIVSTLPTHMSHWLRLDLPSRVSHTFGLPVTHVTATPVSP
jgi:H+/Cl- antiporter ClcA/CBS domain-containing protein